MNLRSAPAELSGNVFRQPFGVAACDINVKVFVCLEFVQHIVDGNLDAAIFLVHHFRGELHLINEQIKFFILSVPDGAFYIFAQSNWISELIIPPLIQFDFQNMIFRNVLRKKILEKQIEKQYGLAAPAYTCDDFYLTVPHTVDQSVYIGISFNHAFHLALMTKPSKLLCWYITIFEKHQGHKRNSQRSFAGNGLSARLKSPIRFRFHRG